jgi:hypothetical protein
LVPYKHKQGCNTLHACLRNRKFKNYFVTRIKQVFALVIYQDITSCSAYRQNYLEDLAACETSTES